MGLFPAQLRCGHACGRLTGFLGRFQLRLGRLDQLLCRLQILTLRRVFVLCVPGLGHKLRLWVRLSYLMVRDGRLLMLLTH